MTRQTRLLIGSALILAIGCSSAQRAAEKLSVEDRITAEALALRAACAELPDNAAPDLKAICAAFAEGDGPMSGDGGPAPIIEERKPIGPGEGNGVRKAE